MGAALRVPAAESLGAGALRDRASLPRLFLIADGFVSGRAGLAADAVCERVGRLVEAGVRGVHLRDHAAAPAAFAEAAGALAARLRARHPDVVLAVNNHPEVAQALGAILHVGHRGPTVEEARRLAGERVLVGFSAHSPRDARRAAEAGADLVFVSPLFRTVSHPDVPPGELVLLQRTCAALADLPSRPCVYALGGITPEHVGACLRAGAHGVAALSGLLEAADPAAAARAYLGAFDDAVEGASPGA
jgi:thiamine-phosphate pyrophosphorylase